MLFLFPARPLMALFERLITNDTKANTVLTNSQILSILQKEFDINVAELHELEIDIYINIVKKFLKDWPQWDAFDRVINKLKKKDGNSEVRSILEQKYKHLKEYLSTMIETAKPLARDAVLKLNNVKGKAPQNDNNDTVLEIYCTRKMLNKFIFNQPHPGQSDSLFNLMDFEPYKLNPALPFYSFASMLHWYGVRLSVELPFFQFSRFTGHRLNHVLVNESNGPRELKKELDTSVHMKVPKLKTTALVIDGIISLLDKILQYYKDKMEYNMIQAIFNVIKSDLNVISETIEIPGSYKQHLNKYPYVRRLFANVRGGQPSRNNLFIEETITPIQDWHIAKFSNIYPTIPIPFNSIPHLHSWLRFECEECKQSFKGDEFLTVLRDHFKVYHTDEPDWSCTNCEKSFAMADLTNIGWQHDC